MRCFHERVKPPKPEDDEEPDDDDNSAELSEEAKLRLSSQRTRTLIELLKITEPKRNERRSTTRIKTTSPASLIDSIRRRLGAKGADSAD